MILHNDGPIWISTGRHRREKSWKNKEITWSELALKLVTPVRTNETYKEYIDLDKDSQSEVKDVGGFVGGAITGGRRVKGSILTRQLLTFDLDTAPLDFVNELQLLFDNAMLVYSTHKHSPATPRYRLVMPLDREVMADEYQAIARKVSEIIGIAWFDPTTYQPERLMYWPSVSRDMELYTWIQDGPWIKADEILGLYKEWTDLSQWPAHPGEIKQREAGLKKQEDPILKRGLVGVFCRQYSISEVIDKYLSDEYVGTEQEDRYSYAHGSTAMGLVVYEDKYAFSHHGTDPASGQLCNAFDLVRLHKFKGLDDDVADHTPVNRLPSYIAMLDLCRADEGVRERMGAERLAEGMKDFKYLSEDGEDTPLIPVEDVEWMKELEPTGKEGYKGTMQNIYLILKHDVNLKGRIKLNEFKQVEVVTGPLPWGGSVRGHRLWTDSDDASLRHYLEVIYKIDSTRKIKDAVMIITQENKFHPVKDYLNSLEWDGVERLDSLLIDYQGADDSEYVRTVTRKSLTAAVARIYQPGIKYDNVLVLTGDQGAKKSTVFDKLGGLWFSDSFGNLKSKEAAEQLQGVWIMEIGELAGLKKAEVEEIKLFISKRVDRYRMPYGHRVGEFPRQCVFFGTSNNFDFLSDPTGNRRFWPVAVDKYKISKDVFELSQADINQIWAEAKYRWNDFENLYLSAEMEEIARQVQKRHTETDDRTEDILKFLNLLLPESWENMSTQQRREWLYSSTDIKEAGTKLRDRVTAAEVWCEVLGGTLKDMNRFNTKPIHNILRGLEGWTMKPPGDGHRIRDKVYGVQQAYYRIGVKTSYL